MADSFIQVPPDGAGKTVDTRTESTNGNHRQVIVLGDPVDNSGLAEVDAVNGLAVDNKTLPPDAATETTLDALNTKVTVVDTSDVAVTSSVLPTDAATQTTLAALNTKVVTQLTLDYDTGGGTQAMQIVGIALPASGGAVAGGTTTNPLQIGDAGGSITVDGTVAVSGSVAVTNAGLTALNGAIDGTEVQVDVVGALPAGTNNIGDVDVLTLPALVAGSAIIGNVRIDQTTPGTTNGVSIPAIAVAATITSVDDTASSAQLLASNAARKGYKLYNDSAQIAYVKEGTTATITDYSYQIMPQGFYESVGVGIYTGRIDAIWAANGSGAMKISELA